MHTQTPASSAVHYSAPLRGKEACRLGINAAYEKMGVPPVIEAADMASINVDEISLMTYLSGFMWCHISMLEQKSQQSREDTGELEEVIVEPDPGALHILSHIWNRNGEKHRMEL